MTDRRDPISPVSSVDARKLAIDARDQIREARATSEETDKNESAAPPQFETYRVVLDPETLRAVTEVRDPQTGTVRFTIPANAEDDAKRGAPTTGNDGS